MLLKSTNIERKPLRRFVMALCGVALVSALSVTDLSAQGRSNKGGEVKGKDRASEVQEMNAGSKSGKTAKKAKKGKKVRRVKRAKARRINKRLFNCLKG